MRLLFALLLATTVQAQDRLRVAVIDTGFTPAAGMAVPNFCETGHFDAVTNTDKGIPKDSHGHGTHIVYTIVEQLKNVDTSKYCIVVIRYFEPGASSNLNFGRSMRSFERAKEIGVDLINYSSSGAGKSDKERSVILSLLDSGTKIITAAGNDSAYLFPPLNLINLFKFKTIETYPGGYDNRIVVVGNLNPDGSPNQKSNYGPRIDVWEIGTDIVQAGVKMTGTSQATAVHTGKIIKTMIERK